MEDGQGLNLDKALEIAENCEKVDTQLAAMATEGQGVKGKKGDSVNVNRIEDKREVLGRIHNSPATDMATPGILVNLPKLPSERSVLSQMWIGRTFPRALQDETETRQRKKKKQAPQGP